MSISRIVNNITAVNANRNLDKTGRALQKSIERLSSGLRINRAGDDAAGLNVANRLRTQVQGLNQAVTNASDGINLINVAEGALEETTIRLNRIRQLSVQAANTAVNDVKARQAIQDEVFQSIDEITRIANTTQFGSSYLLNGDFSIKTNNIVGQQNIGMQIDSSPVASTLASGKSFLNIIKVQDGTAQIVSADGVGNQQILNTGIRNQTDVAISFARFSKTSLLGAGVAPATLIAGASGPNNRVFFNGVSILNKDVITFTGTLADGITKFNGSLSIGAGATYTFGAKTDTTVANAKTHLIGAINKSILDAEKALFGVTTVTNIPTAYQSTVTLGGRGANSGRLLMFSSGNYINQSSINLTLLRGANGGVAGKVATVSNGVTRSGVIGVDSALSGGGKIGNSITAITGSTFGVGDFVIDVQDAQAAQQRKLENTIIFRDGNGAIINKTTSLSQGGGTHNLVLNGTFVGGIYTGGMSLQNNDTITLTGTNADGTTFNGVFTYTRLTTTQRAVDTTMNDFKFSSLSGLLKELNYRTRDYSGVTALNGTQSRFEDALFTFTSNGTLQLVDDIGRSNSQIAYTLTFQNGLTHTGTAKNPTTNFTLQDAAALTQEGFYEEATFRINNGDAVRAKAGDVVTLQGAKSTIEGVPQPRVTFRLGNGFTAGTDELVNTPNRFVGTLNGGAQTTFINGDQKVTFVDGNSGGNRGVARFVSINFDNIIDVTRRTDGLPDAGRTIVVSTINSSLNFHVGANAGQAFRASIGDLTSQNLGFGLGSGRAVANINVTNISGANDAMRIVDEALDQVNKTRSILGSITNRLEATISNLSVSSENLNASESRIRDADIARETSEFTKNQVLQQAGISVLAQSNFLPQGFLGLIGGR